MGGCASSKLNDTPAVVLCHDRCTFLHTAIRHRDYLSQSHSDYSHSLRQLSLSLSRSLYLSFFTISPSLPLPQSDRCISPESREESRDSSEPDDTADLTPVSSSSSDWPTVAVALSSSTCHDEVHPPPPPPPPSLPSSGWDFLGFFDSFEKFEPHRSFKRVQEYEGEEVGRAMNIPQVKTGEGVGGRGGSDGGDVVAGGELLYVVARFQSLMERVAGYCGEASMILMPVEHSPSPCEGTETTSVNISSVMENLWMWERKLSDEVKEEEKFKLVREKKCRQLKGMIEKGAETHVITEAKSVITALSINIKIAVDIVDNISLTIKKLQNEQLLPLLVSFFNRMKEMWKGMAHCHKKLSITMAGTKELVAAMMAADANRSGSHSEAMEQLKLDFQHWDLSFSGWMDAQRDYIKVMAHWLTAPLPYHSDPKRVGSAPGSPRKPDGGAPSPFAFCHSWSQALDLEGLRVKDVVKAMKDCISVLGRPSVGPTVEDPHRRKRKVKGMMKEKQKVQRLVHARDKKMDLLTQDQCPLPSEEEEGGLHACLLRVFEAMEAVAEISLHCYQEVSLTIDESSLQINR